MYLNVVVLHLTYSLTDLLKCPRVRRINVGVRRSISYLAYSSMQAPQLLIPRWLYAASRVLTAVFWYLTAVQIIYRQAGGRASKPARVPGVIDMEEYIGGSSIDCRRRRRRWAETDRQSTFYSNISKPVVVGSSVADVSRISTFQNQSVRSTPLALDDSTPQPPHPLRFLTMLTSS